MARTTPRPPPTATRTLQPLGRHCPLCGETMWAAYHNYRTITTLDNVLHLTLQIRRCLNRACPHFRRPYRPEAEGRLALPKHEFGLDVVAWVGTLRYAQHRSLPEIHQHLLHRGVTVAPRTVTPLLERYDALRTLARTDTRACSGSPKPTAGLFWRWMVSNRMSVMRRSGSSGIASRGKFSWLVVCCPQPRRIWQPCSGQSVKPYRCPLLALFRMANCPFAVLLRRCSPMCHTNYVTSIISTRRRSPFMKPTAMPRKN